MGSTTTEREHTVVAALRSVDAAFANTATVAHHSGMNTNAARRTLARLERQGRVERETRGRRAYWKLTFAERYGQGSTT